MSNVPKYIQEFSEAVYPDAPNLALASFDEQKFIEDATSRIRQLEAALVEAHPECRCHECTAIWERRYPTKNAAPQAETCLCLSFPHACPVHRRDGPIDSTVKPSAWD